MAVNYNTYIITELEKFLKENKYSFGQLLRTITREQYSGLRIENRSQFEKTNEQWLEIIETALEDEKASILCTTDEQWSEMIQKEIDNEN